MLLAQVESFLEVVRSGSMTRAAGALFVTQPTLTERLKTLETELGKPLFSRTRRYGLQLTAAGEAFLPYAERIVAVASDAKQAVARADRDTSATIKIGVATVVGSAVLGDALARLRASDRTSSITVRSGTASEVVKMILRREVTLGITRPVRNEHIEISPIYTEELVPVVAPNHPLAARETVRASDMANEPLIIVAETVTYEYLNRLIARGGGPPPKIPVEVEGMEMARALLDGRAGIAFLPLGSILIDLESHRLVRLKLIDVPALRVRVCGLRRFDAPPESKAMENLIGFLRDAGAGIEARAFQAEPNVPAVIDATARSDARRRRVRTRVVHTL